MRLPQPTGGEVTAASPASVLEPWIAARLHSLDGAPTADPHIDMDRDAEGAPLAGPETAYTPAAVLVGLVQREEGLSVVLTRRADTLSRHSGQVAFPGGRADPGETAVQAALREAEEEIGLQRRFVRPVGLGDLYCTFTGFEITPVVAFLEGGFSLTPAAAEVAEVFEAPFRFLMDPQSFEERVWEGPRGARRYYAATYGEQLIWGATAGILRSLWRRLFAAEALDAEALSRPSPRPAAAGR